MAGEPVIAQQRCVVNNDADASLPLHRHDDARVIVVLDGEVLETDLSGRHRYVKGDVFFRPPFCAHANTPSGAPSSFMRLPVSRNAWLAMMRANGWRGLRGRLDMGSRHERSMLLFAKNGDEVVSFLASQGFPVSASSARNMDKELQGAPADVGRMPSYERTRRFIRRFGLTPSAHRREARLQRAYSLLLFSNYGLARIAVECGYADQSHFSRELKAATGWSPMRFRKAFED